MKILVVNVNWLGDVVFSSPIFRALRVAYPGSHITCLAVPGVKDILDCVAELDEIFVYDQDGRHRSILGKLQLVLRLREQKFDQVFLLHRSMTRALMVFLAGIPQRIGYDTKARGPLLTHRVKYLRNVEAGIHRADFYGNIVESVGVKIQDKSVQLHVDDNLLEDMTQKLKAEGCQASDRLVTIHPGGNWLLKRWPVPSFCVLIKRILQEADFKVVLAGGHDDLSIVEGLKKYLSKEIAAGRVIVLTGLLNLKQLMGLMKKSSVVVSADSGPLHLAHSVGAKVVGIYGPTRPEITGPRGKNAYCVLQHDVGCNRQPCYFLKCHDNVCMQSVTVQEVLSAIYQLI